MGEKIPEIQDGVLGEIGRISTDPAEKKFESRRHVGTDFVRAA